MNERHNEELAGEGKEQEVRKESGRNQEGRSHASSTETHRVKTVRVRLPALGALRAGRALLKAPAFLLVLAVYEIRAAGGVDRVGALLSHATHTGFSGQQGAHLGAGPRTVHRRARTRESARREEYVRWVGPWPQSCRVVFVPIFVSLDVHSTPLRMSLADASVEHCSGCEYTRTTVVYE